MGYLDHRDTDDNALTLAIDSAYADALQLLHLLLHNDNLSRRNPQVYLGLCCEDEKECDVIKIITEVVRDLHRYIKELYVINFSPDEMFTF